MELVAGPRVATILVRRNCMVFSIVKMDEYCT